MTAQHKLTFNEILAGVEKDNSERLMRKARTANYLAKRSRGSQRRTAYGVKSRALSSLVKKMPARVDIVNRKLSKHKSVRDQALKGFLDWAVIADDGFLSFRYDENESMCYGPFEDGTALAMDGKWYGDEAIAEWLKQYSGSGGRMVFHSLEADGEAFGYEFDGKGRMRMLSLEPFGKWT